MSGLLKLCLFASAFALLGPQCQSARILTIAPMTSRSHFILGYKISRALVDAGHDVTVISSFNDGYNSTKGSYRSIEITGMREKMDEFMKGQMNLFDGSMMNPLIMLPFMVYFFGNFAEIAISHPNVQELIKSDEKFDVVLMEQFGFEALKALASHFEAHLMIYTPTGQSFYVDSYVGTPTLPSYAAEPLFSFGSDMTFFQRVQNTLMRAMLILTTELYTHPVQNNLVHKYISPDINLVDVMYNISVAFVNTHISVAPALPKSPNMVFIGGFHMDDPKPLPKDLKEILDNSKNGVIFFSMGSVLKSKDMPVDKRDAILRVFKGLKETVLWKYEDDSLENIPDNVHIRKWLPQVDLLAHPNLKLFITHGGYGSTTEAIYHGKPVLALPVFADQHLNGHTLEDQGVGLAKAFIKIDEEIFRSMLTEVLNNPKYAKKAKELSEIYQDRQVKPLDEVVYWVDYVVKHNGAPHLRSVVLQLPWYKRYLLDVLAFIGLVTFGFLFVLKKALCKLGRKICSKSVKKEKVN